MKPIEDIPQKLVIEGLADDLFEYDESINAKSISLVQLAEDDDSADSCDYDITFTSFSDEGKHTFLDSFLGHKVRMTVEIID